MTNKPILFVFNITRPLSRTPGNALQLKSKFHHCVCLHANMFTCNWQRVASQMTTTWVRISAWVYPKGVSLWTWLHYLWRSPGPFSLPYIPVRMLRSESYSLLMVPRSHTAIYGERSFRASAPRLWNELPRHMKLAANKDIFCKVLKTHLFKLAYL